MTKILEPDARRGNDYAIHTPFMERSYDFQFSLWIRVRAGQKNRVAMLVGHFFDAIHNSPNAWVGDVRHDAAHRHGASHHQASSDQARPVTLLARDLTNSLGRLGIHNGALPQSSRNRGMRNADNAADVFNGDGPFHIFPSVSGRASPSLARPAPHE